MPADPTGQEPKRPSRLWAAIAQKCPRCLIGSVFSGQMAMNERCPKCGLTFEREPGYFFGAMYVSYGMAIPIISVLALIGYLLFPSLPDHVMFLLAWGAFLVFVPMVFRYSRVIWMHLDHSWDPPTEK